MATAYNISTISLYKEIAERVEKGLMHWGNFSRDSVHPNQEGSEMYAACIIDFLKGAWKNPQAKVYKAAKLPRALDKDCYENGHFISPQNYQKSVGFELQKAWKPNYRVINIVLPTPVWQAPKPGAEITTEFSGTAVGIYYMSCSDSGMLEYSIDGGEFTKLDTFNDRKNMPRYVIFSDTLKKGKHKLTIRTIEEKNKKSAGHSVRLLHLMAN